MDELTVLMVHEHRDSLDIWEHSLTIRGVHVLTAHDGCEVVMCAATEVPDVVVLDLDASTDVMLETARLLHELPPTRDIPVVALTGQTDAALVERARTSGMRAVFIKPFHPDSLVPELVRLCGSVAAQRSAGRPTAPPYLLVETSDSLPVWPLGR